MSLTPNELLILIALDNSEYCEHLSEPVWGFSARDHAAELGLRGQAYGGTLASLVKKGYVVFDTCQPSHNGDGYNNDDSTVYVTRAGILAFRESGHRIKKMYD